MDEYSPSSSASAPQMRFGKIDDLLSRVAVGIDGARKFLFSQQHEEGYWCGELEADTTLESDYILLHSLFGTSTPERFEKAVKGIFKVMKGKPPGTLVSFTVKLPKRWVEDFEALAAKEEGSKMSDVARRALAIGLDALKKRSR